MAFGAVRITVRFVTIMQRYSGAGKREVQMELPPEPSHAVQHIIEQFQIPWEDNLERYVRVFINGLVYDSYVETGERLESGDTIAFIPSSSGG
jgi:molybdopterin converting factor small subunit